MDRERLLASEDGVTSHGATRENSDIMDRELFIALEVGDIDTIETLHEQDKDVLDGVTFQGDTALHIAAREGHLELVKRILQLNPSLAKEQNNNDNTALHEAAKSGNTEVVEVLLEFKESCKYRQNAFGETTLVIASQYGHNEIVKLLLEASSSEDIVEWDQSLREAAYRGYKDVVVEMLKKTPSQYIEITLSLHEDLNFTRLLRRLQAWFWGFPKTPILHAAVQGGDLEVVKAMLNHDSWESNFMTVEDEYGRCAIHVAAIKGHSNIINEFMSRTPDSVNIRSSDGKSVLHSAVEYNQLNVVECLLANKEAKKVAKLVSRDRDDSRNTALHSAAINGASVELLECLLSPPGVDMNILSLNVNAVNDDGMSALDIAASAAAQDNPNCSKIVQRLEAVGAVRLSLKRKSNTTSDSKQGADSETVNTHIVVASLIATITFAAMFQIPGGIEDDKKSIHYGAAKLAFHTLFKIFLYSDTVAFLASITVIVGWLLRNHFQYSIVRTFLSSLSEASLLGAIIWTAVAFVIATIIVIIPSNFESLKSKDKEAFSKYELLWHDEVLIAVITPFVIAAAIAFLSPALIKKIHSASAVCVLFQLLYLGYIVFYGSFKKS